MFGNTNKKLEEAFSEKQTVSNPVEAVVSRNLTTAEHKPLTQEQINEIRKKLGENISKEIKAAMGCHGATKFTGTAVWPIPKPDMPPLGIIRLDVSS
jgi:hypothetical protein